MNTNTQITDDSLPMDGHPLRMLIADENRKLRDAMSTERAAETLVGDTWREIFRESDSRCGNPPDHPCLALRETKSLSLQYYKQYELIQPGPLPMGHVPANEPKQQYNRAIDTLISARGRVVQARAALADARATVTTYDLAKTGVGYVLDMLRYLPVSRTDYRLVADAIMSGRYLAAATILIDAPKVAAEWWTSRNIGAALAVLV